MVLKNNKCFFLIFLRNKTLWKSWKCFWKILVSVHAALRRQIIRWTHFKLFNLGFRFYNWCSGEINFLFLFKKKHATVYRTTSWYLWKKRNPDLKKMSFLELLWLFQFFFLLISYWILAILKFIEGIPRSGYFCNKQTLTRNEITVFNTVSGIILKNLPGFLEI